MKEVLEGYDFGKQSCVIQVQGVVPIRHPDVCYAGSPYDLGHGGLPDSRSDGISVDNINGQVAGASSCVGPSAVIAT